MVGKSYVVSSKNTKTAVLHQEEDKICDAIYLKMQDDYQVSRNCSNNVIVNVNERGKKDVVSKSA